MPDAPSRVTSSWSITKQPSIRLPRNGTESAEGFFAARVQILDFFNWLSEMAALVDAQEKHAWQLSGKMLDKARAHRQFTLELVFSRLIENYEIYLSSLLHEIFVARPETMKSAEKVDLDLVLSHKTLISLVQEIAELKVLGLSYKSFEAVATFFRDRFHVSVMEDAYIAVTIEAIETRNISGSPQRVMGRGPYVS